MSRRYAVAEAGNQVTEMETYERQRSRERLAKMLEKLSPEIRDQVIRDGDARRAKEPTSVQVGDMAPDFDLPVLGSDERVRLSDLRGKPVGLIFGSYT